MFKFTVAKGIEGPELHKRCGGSIMPLTGGFDGAWESGRTGWSAGIDRSFGGAISGSTTQQSSNRNFENCSISANENGSNNSSGNRNGWKSFRAEQPELNNGIAGFLVLADLVMDIDAAMGQYEDQEREAAGP
jgi:hypothetical protein